jgi:hypothetical protein
MEIQYAIFCEDISYGETITLKTPISSLEVNMLSSLKQLNMPLFITTIGGKKGTKYKLTIETTSDWGVSDKANFDFVLRANKLTQGDYFIIHFKPIHIGTHIFNLL